MPWPFTPRRRRNRRRGQTATPVFATPGNLTSIVASTTQAGHFTLLFDQPVLTPGFGWPSNWFLGGQTANVITSNTGSTVLVTAPLSTSSGTAYNFGATTTVRTSDGGPINAKTGTST